MRLRIRLREPADLVIGELALVVARSKSDDGKIMHTQPAILEEQSPSGNWYAVPFWEENSGEAT